MDDLTTEAEEQQQQQQQQQHRCASRRERRRAEPNRGVDVLDRPLRRARRGHGPDPRRTDPAADRGHDRRPGDGLPQPALHHGRRATRRPVGRRRDRPRAAGLRPHRVRIRRRGPRGSQGERAARPGDAVRRDVGGAQHDAPLGRHRPVPQHGSQHRLPLGARPGGADQRGRRRDDDPRRGLAVPRPRAQPRAGRHDLTSGRDGRIRRRGRVALDQHAARLRRPRGVPADLQGPRDRARCRGVPAARPAVPALGGLRAQPGRAVPGQPRGRPAGRLPERGAPDDRPDPRRPGVPPARRRHRPTCPPRWSASSTPAPGRPRRSRAGSSPARRERNWLGGRV